MATETETLLLDAFESLSKQTQRQNEHVTKALETLDKAQRRFGERLTELETQLNRLCSDETDELLDSDLPSLKDLNAWLDELERSLAMQSKRIDRIETRQL